MPQSCARSRVWRMHTPSEPRMWWLQHRWVAGVQALCEEAALQQQHACLPLTHLWPPSLLVQAAAESFKRLLAQHQAMATELRELEVCVWGGGGGLARGGGGQLRQHYDRDVTVPPTVIVVEEGSLNKCCFIEICYAHTCLHAQVRQAERRAALSEVERVNQERKERAAQLDEVRAGACQVTHAPG
jgi:hypothetical protein